MAISEQRLEQMTRLPSATAYKEKYDSIKNALDAYFNWPDDLEYTIYLQGSYANSTNIKGDSDVDVVVEMSSVFYSDTDNLDLTEKNAYNLDRTEGKYTLSQFRSHVIAALQSHFGASRVIEGNKSVKINPPASGGLFADVVVCAQYRKYWSYPNSWDARYSRGIVFWTTQTNEKIVNYPKLHIDNGEAKNKLSSQYKATVRMIKNLKSNMVEYGYILDKTAPSYFVECLISNVPDNVLTDNRSLTLIKVVTWYESRTAEQRNKLLCGNHVHFLFRNTSTAWNESSATAFIKALWKYYDNG